MFLFKRKKEIKKSYEETLFEWDKDAESRRKERLTLFPYNFSLDKEAGRRVKGLCALYKETFECWEDGKKIRTLPVSALTGAFLSADGGAARIIVKKGEERFAVAAGDLKYKKRFGALSGALDRFFEEGLYKEPKVAKESVCPKCGRPYRPGSSVCTRCGGKKAQFGWLFRMLRPSLPLLIFSVFLFLGFSAAGLIPPVLSKQMVDGYLKNADAGSAQVLPYLLVVLAFFGVTVLQRLISGVRFYVTSYIGAKTTERLRASVFEKVQELSLAGVNRRTAGELMQRVSSDTDVIGNFLANTLGHVIEQAAFLLAIAVIFLVRDFTVDTRLFLLVFIPVIPGVILFKLFHKRIHRIYHMLWQVSAKASSRMHDIFSGIKVVKSYGREEDEIGRYDRSITGVRIIEKRNETFWAIFSPFVNLMLCAGEFFIIYFIGSKVLGGDLTLGEMTMYSSYAAMIYGPLRTMTFLPRMITRMLTSLSKIYDVMNDQDVTTHAAQPKEIKVGGRVTLKDVTFGYVPGKDVLRHIDLDVRPGEMIGLVGKSGVGKSTLTNLVMRLYDADEGQVLIDGVDVKELSPESLRLTVGAVLQETFLFGGSVRQNIAYAKPDATGEEIIAAAKRAGAHEFIMKMPDGYDSYVGEKGNTLSGGEKQRIAIARALLLDPKILILDEATSSLDTKTEKQIQDALSRLIEGRTTIAIAHRLSTLRNATRIIVLDDRRIAEQGTHEELMRNENGIYYGLVMAQRTMSQKRKKREE